jgi:MOSC domain-containing protein YiiM
MEVGERGTVRGIAIRDASGGPMREIDRATADSDAGIRGNARVSPKRGLTLLDLAKWREALAACRADLPWHARRANVLVEGLDLARLVGRRVRIGDAVVEILGETKPCANMDRAFPGLRAALETGFRGGAHGRVVRTGSFAAGDAVVPMEGDGAPRTANEAL